MWIIRNFSFYTEKTGEKIESPIFQSDHDDGFDWCLDLYPRGIGEEEKDYVSLYLRLVSKISCGTVAKFEFYIWNIKGEKCNVIGTESPQEFKTGMSDRFGFPRFISRSQLLDKNEQLLLNDRLTIVCQIECTTGSRHVTFKPKTVQLPYEDEVDILPQLHRTMVFTDVTFSIRGQELHAHKAVLATRSPIFSAMFKADANKEFPNKIEITDISYEAFEQMLKYMYTGDVDEIEAVAEELLAASDKYQLNYLKAVCEENMFNRFTIDNVAEYLVLADVHSASQLKQLAIDYINENAVDVVKTESWQNLLKSHLHLLPDVYVKSIQN